MKKLLLLITFISLPSYSAVSANVSFTSDYIWRGMTQSDGPAIQGGFDYANDSGFYAGIWGSNVNFNDGAGSATRGSVARGLTAGAVSQQRCVHPSPPQRASSHAQGRRSAFRALGEAE